MRKIKIAMAAGVILFALSSCMQMEKTEDGTKAERVSEEEKAKTGKEDVSGIYTDRQGTSDVYSQLVLALQPDGTYEAEISIYRTTELEGTAVWDEDTLRFTSVDPHVLADISIAGGKADVTIIADAAGILNEDIYSFPDGAPDKPEEGHAGDPSAGNPSAGDPSGESASQQTLFEKIAEEISYAEEQEKEIEKKQKEAITQMDMNITAADLTKARVYKLAEYAK